MKKYFVTMVFMLLGCGQHTFDNVFDDFFGTSSSSDFSSSSSEVSSSSLLSSNSQYLSSSSLPSSSSRLGISSSSVQSINYEEEEAKLYEIMMQYREEKGLPRIPISKSLTYVAQLHVRDLQENSSNFDASCNLHSWSNKGCWTACCYNPNHTMARCMWNKPSELTSYTGNGYEIAYGQGSTSTSKITAESALDGWKNSSGHNAVIINENTWKYTEWNAIGIAMYGAFAVTWFGEEFDECKGDCEKKETECNEETDYKWCVADTFFSSVCRELNEDFTIEQCNANGFQPRNKAPENCIYL